MSACRGEVRRADKVVARTGQHVEALFRDRLRIAEDVDDLGGAALLDAAAGLVFQRRDAAGLVARARVLVDHLAVADKILLEVIDHADRFLEDLCVLAAGKQNVLRAEHLRNFGQDRGAAERDQSVGETSHGRVCRDSGETVGAAALHADDQLGCRNRLALELGGILRELMDELAALLNFIFNILAGEEFHAIRVILAEPLKEEVHREVFAAECQAENAACVRMADQRGEKLSGLVEVAAQLAAAERMAPVIETVDGAGHHILVLLHDLFCDAVHAADDRDDPDLVADRGTAVFSTVAHEGLRSDFRQRINLMVIHILSGL